MISKRIPLFPFIVVWASVCFFKPFIMPKSMFLSATPLVIFILFMMFCMNNTRYKIADMPYKNLFILYALFLLINTVSCWYFREQSVWLSLKCLAPFFMVFIMPTFKSWKLSNENWERVLLALFIIYMICNYLQYIFINTQFFYLTKEFERMEIEKRPVLYGEGILSLGALICLNRLLLSKKRVYAFLYVASCLLLFLQGFRMMLLGFMVVSICLTYSILKFSRTWIIYIVVGGIFIASLSQLPVVREKLDEITTRSQTATLDNEDYARYRSWTYFNNIHFKNNVERILGSGQTIIYSKGSQQDKKPVFLSKYSKERSELVYYYYIWSVDWGLIGLSWECGIPFTIVFILILIAMFRQKLNKKHRYINYWTLMLLLVGITKPISYIENVFAYYAVLLTIISQDININKQTSAHNI